MLTLLRKWSNTMTSLAVVQSFLAHLRPNFQACFKDLFSRSRSKKSMARFWLKKSSFTSFGEIGRARADDDYEDF